MSEADICKVQPDGSDFRLSLNFNTLGDLDYESQLKISRQAGWQAVGLSIDSLGDFAGFRLEEPLPSRHVINPVPREDHITTRKSVEEAKVLLEKNGLRPVEICAFRNWIYTKGKDQTEMFGRFRKFSKISANLGWPIIIVTTPCPGKHDDTLAKENFKEICRIASEDGNRVAFEFSPSNPNFKTLKKGWDIVKAANASNGGILLDCCHYLTGGSSLEDLNEVPIGKIFHVHVNDLKDVDIGLDYFTLVNNYRVLPGEGKLVFDVLLENLFVRGYSGYYSLEVLNKEYRRDDPLNLAIRARISLEKLLKKYGQETSQRTG